MPGHALAMQADKPFRSLQQVRRTNKRDGLFLSSTSLDRAVSNVLRAQLIGFLGKTCCCYLLRRVAGGSTVYITDR